MEQTIYGALSRTSFRRPARLNHIVCRGHASATSVNRILLCICHSTPPTPPSSFPGYGYLERCPSHLGDVHAATRSPPITLGEGDAAVPGQLEPENGLLAQLSQGPCRRLAGLDEGLR